MHGGRGGFKKIITASPGRSYQFAGQRDRTLIQDILKRVMVGRTSIVIAHRLSTILAAELILVMDRGRIVEHSTHADLLERGGLYANLYATQFNHGLVKAE